LAAQTQDGRPAADTIVSADDEQQPRLGPLASWNITHIGNGAGYIHDRFWDEALLGEGTVSQGYKQLYGVLRKLRDGKPITVVALGTSISDRGGCWQKSMEQLEASVGMLRFGREVQEKKCSQRGGFMTSFMSVVNDTWPHPDHLLVNLAVPGALSDCPPAARHACPARYLSHLMQISGPPLARPQAARQGTTQTSSA
jgi:hypothetical protein